MTSFKLTGGTGLSITSNWRSVIKCRDEDVFHVDESTIN